LAPRLAAVMARKGRRTSKNCFDKGIRARMETKVIHLVQVQVYRYYNSSWSTDSKPTSSTVNTRAELGGMISPNPRGPKIWEENSVPAVQPSSRDSDHKPCVLELSACASRWDTCPWDLHPTLW
jgi:hypothetical protein